MSMSINQRIVSLFLASLIVLASTSFLASHANAQDANIPPMLLKKLRLEAFPMIFGQQPQLVNQQVANLVTKSTPELMDAIEQAAISEGYGSIKTAYLNALETQLELTNLAPPKRPNHALVGYLVSATQEQLANFLTTTEQSTTAFLGAQIPDDWKASRKFFGDAQISHELFEKQEKLGMFVAGLIDNTKKKGKALPELDPLFEEFSQTATEFVALKNEILEREIKLRLDRFNRSATIVKQPGDFETRLTATMFLFEDRDALLSFFKSSVPKPYQTESLNETDLAVTVKNTADEILKSKAPVVTKAALLTSALTSWKLGRYGYGPLAGGLLKGKDLGRRNVSSGGLRMPIEPSVIDEELDPPPEYPSYERRHKYTWDVEEDLPAFYIAGMCGQPGRTEFPPYDETIPTRIVGTGEYGTALDSIQKLTSNSTTDEIDTYDKVIAEFPELSFYSGDEVLGKQGRSLKSSLAWMTALARVELASTHALYLAGDEAFIPKSTAEFGLREYLAVLLDDAANHLKDLDSDPEFKKAFVLTGTFASVKTIEYLRRLKLIDNMLQAIEVSGESKFEAMATSYRKDVRAFEKPLQAQIRATLSIDGSSTRVSDN